MLKAIASAAAGENGPSVWLGRLRTTLDVRYLALVSSIATYGLIVLGGTVRATDSGLACPDWPRCHGQLVPPFDSHVLIEYSHRLAAVAVGLLILATAIAVWLGQRDNRTVLAGCTAAVVLLVAQALVGGATVNMELPATIVAVHLAMALTLLTVLIVTTVEAFWHRRRLLAGGPAARLPPAWRLPVLPAATALATLALILLGSYVANSGASLVYPDWPLFNGTIVSAGGRLADLHYAHRLMALVVGLLLLAVAAQSWRKERADGQSIPLAAVGFAFVLYVAQVFVGASNIWFDLATSVRIVHLALASAMWAALVLGISWVYSQRGAV